MRPIVLIVASDDWHRYQLSLHLQQEGFGPRMWLPATMSWHRSTGYDRTWSLSASSSTMLQGSTGAPDPATI